MLPNLMDESQRNPTYHEIESVEESIADFKLQKSPEIQEQINLQSENTLLKKRIIQKDNLIQTKENELKKR